MTDTNYREAKRVHTSVLAAAEKRLLIWIAERLPRWVNSDHLTVLAGLAIAVAGICYWIGPGSPLAMATAILMLGLNWFGDSLDGTLARVRHHERPRYGFYVDHVLDVIGILFLLAVFVTPLASMVPFAATGPVLVVVGYLMATLIRDIDFADVEEGFPALLGIILMPITFSITVGIGASFVTWVLIKAVRGKFAEIHPLMWIVAIAFAVYFAQNWLNTLL